MPHDAFLRCYVFVRSLRSWGAHVSILIMRVIPGRRSEAEASPESILPDLWLWIPGSRPSAEPRNDWTRFCDHTSSVRGEASLRRPVQQAFSKSEVIREKIGREAWLQDGQRSS